MDNIPSSKVSQTVDILRNSIAEGEWVDVLPGERVLTKRLMISRACLRKALIILTQEGILAAARPSKKRVILKTANPKDAEKKKGRVIFLTPNEAHESTPLVLQQLAQLRHHLEKARMYVTMVSSAPLKPTKNVKKRLTDLKSSYPNSLWVLHQTPEHVQCWFAENKVRATVLGSVFSGIDLPYVDIDFKSASRHATGMMLAKGHTRFALIRFRSHLAGDDCAMAGMLESLTSHSGHENLPEPLVLCHNFHVERLTNALDALFFSANSTKAPTAIVVLNHHHFLTTFTHLLSRGVRIPQDVSIVSLTHDAIFESLSPRPVSYGVGEKLILELAQMLINPTKLTYRESSLLLPEPTDGKTVANKR